MVVVVERGRIVGCWEDGFDDGRRKGFVLCARKYNGLWDLISQVAALLAASGLPMGAVRQMTTRG